LNSDDTDNSKGVLNRRYKSPDPRGKVFHYLFVEDQDNLTLIDPSFLSQLPILENYLLDIGYDIKNIKRIS